MNWVGGARNRIRTKDEKQRQKEFFEKKKYGSKMKRLNYKQNSPKKTSIPPSLDLLSLQAADFTAKQFRKNDAENSSKGKVKRVELDRSKGLFPSHHPHEDLELPMSPGSPSKLQLQESEESNSNCLQSGDILRRDINRPSMENMDHALLCDTTQDDLQVLGCSDPRSLIDQASHFHSTPMPESMPYQAQPVTLKHQGKHFEDLFFSFAHGNNEVLTQEEDISHVPSAASSDGSEDQYLSDSCDYSPLSSIPSVSSVASSVPCHSQDTQQCLQEADSSMNESHQTQKLPKRVLTASPVYLTQTTSPPFPNTCKHLPERFHSDGSIVSYGESRVEMKNPPKTKEKFGSTPRPVDLTCKEEDEFLSPFCKRARSAATCVQESRPKTHQQVHLPDLLSSEKPTGVSEMASTGRRTPVNKKSGFKKESAEGGSSISCSSDGQVNSVKQKANSFKWKAFVSGQSITDNTNHNEKESNKKTTTKTMSEVCERILKEVLDLDSEMGQLLPSSTSSPGSLPNTADIITNPKVETMEFSDLLTDEEQTKDPQKRDRKELDKFINQSPCQSQLFTDKTHCISDTSELQRSHPQCVNQAIKLDERESPTCRADKPQTVKSLESQVNVAEDRVLLDSSDDQKTDFVPASGTAIKTHDELAVGDTHHYCLDLTARNLPTTPDSDTSSQTPHQKEELVLITCETPQTAGGCAEKASQCMIPETESKETQCRADEFADATSSSACLLSKTEPTAGTCDTKSPGTYIDAYDACILS